MSIYIQICILVYFYSLYYIFTGHGPTSVVAHQTSNQNICFIPTSANPGVLDSICQEGSVVYSKQTSY